MITGAPVEQEAAFSNYRFASLINELVEQGGPEVRDYPKLDYWLQDLSAAKQNGEISEFEIQTIRKAFGEALSPETMQGFALTKPHGYAGDFEMIDRIYTGYLCAHPDLRNWDLYYHQHAAPKAVRNRKLVLHRLLDQLARRKPEGRILKIAVGPGRSMFEWWVKNPTAALTFDCIEIDPKAIDYAKNLNRSFLDRIQFQQGNALRFKPTEHYDLIWIAGLFDYFNDKTFVRVAKRLMPAISPGGEFVIGNFSDRNPSRAYMELLGDWTLYHRSSEKLRHLAKETGAEDSDIKIDAEPEGVNLFLHWNNV